MHGFVFFLFTFFCRGNQRRVQLRKLKWREWSRMRATFSSLTLTAFTALTETQQKTLKPWRWQSRAIWFRLGHFSKVYSIDDQVPRAASSLISGDASSKDGGFCRVCSLLTRVILVCEAKLVPVPLNSCLVQFVNTSCLFLYWAFL